MDLLIYTPQGSPRLAYVCQVIFTEWYGISYQITTDVSAFRQKLGPRLQYCSEAVCEGILWMQANGLLFEKGTSTARPVCEETYESLALVFPSQKKDEWHNDIFATTFYFLSRYEEYQGFTADAHGRFPAAASAAAQADLLHLPIVDAWVARLIERLQGDFPELIMRPPKFQLALSYDIDQVWAYRHRSWRGYASTIRDLLKGRFSALQQRWNVGRKPITDPFYTFDQLDQFHKKHQLSAIYFWLLADPSPFDRNADPALQEMQEIIQQVAAHYSIGIHPSYRSNTDEKVLRKEIHRLQDIAKQDITHSRQHFLRLHVPSTYRQLLAAGIRHDYSMGFADQVGFRAGTSHSFPWYDLEQEAITELWIHPFCAMDVSLKNYQHLSAAEAEEVLLQLLKNVYSVQGTFRLLWHNSSFSEQHGWTGWREVYERVVARAVGME